MGNGTAELKFLAVAILLGVIHLMAQALSARRQQGLKWAGGPRDQPMPVDGLAGRMERAFANYRETFPLFAAAVIACYLAGKIGPVTYWASLAYVVARAVYIPLYGLGVRGLRSLVWAISFAGIVVLAVRLVL
jgi:uncharacterized MAPEG superfamily protein